MKKIISVVSAILLLCSCVLICIPAVAAEEPFKGTNCVLNQDGSVTLGGNGYYTQTDLTKFSEGEEATITITMDQVGDSWNSNGFALIVNSELTSTPPSDAWLTNGGAGMDGVFAFVYYLKTTDAGVKQLLASKFTWGSNANSTARAGWSQPEFAENAPLTISFTVKKVNGVVTIVRGGKTWAYNNDGDGDYPDGVVLPDGYLGIATAPNAKVTIHGAMGATFGTNYVSNLTYEDGNKGFWVQSIGGPQTIVEGGYHSEHSLHCAVGANSGKSRLYSNAITIGDAYGQVPMNTWCTINFKVRTTAGAQANLLMNADFKPSGSTGSFSVSLAPPNKTPLDGDNWVEITARFKMTIDDNNLALIELRRYDWSYLLSSSKQLQEGETLSTVAIVMQSESDLWFDDVVLSYVVENEAIEPTLTATPSKVAVGEEFTVNYTLTNTGDYVVKNIPYNFDYNPLMLKALTDVSGVMELPANGSATVSARFEVLEGGAAVITTGGVAGVKEAAVRVSCTGRGYYFGDSHSHSVESDGKNTPYENLKQLYDLGMSFNIAADHNAVIEDDALLGRWDDALSQVRNEITNPDRYVNIVANENSKDWNHLLQYFGKVSYYTPYTFAGFQDIIAKQKAAGGLNFIAHPFLETTGRFWPILEGPSVIIPELREVNGFEIINSQTLDSTYITVAQSLEWWDRYNITGWARYVGIGNSDGHKVSELGGSYNCLLIDELTEENIKEAFTNGNLYFTTGPQLRYTLDGADMGGNAVVSTDNEKVSLNVTAYTPNGNPIEKVVVYRYAIGEDIDALYQAGRDNAMVLYERDTKNGQEDLSLFNYSGEIEVSAGEFVRVEVYAAQDLDMVIGTHQIAMSNPIWVVDANEKVLDHIEIKENATKQVYAKGETLDLSGLKVNAVYTDGTKSEVTDYKVSPAEGTALIEPGKHTVTISYTHEGVTGVVTYDVTVEHRDGATYYGSNCVEDTETGNVSVEGGGYYTQTTYTKFSEGEEATITINVDKIGGDLQFGKNIWFNKGFALIINPELTSSIPDASLWDSQFWGTEPVDLFAYCFENAISKVDGVWVEQGLKGSRVYPGNTAANRCYPDKAGTYILSYVDWVRKETIGDDKTITITVKKDANGRVKIYFNGYAWDANGTLDIPDGYLGIWTSEDAEVTVTSSTTTGEPVAPINGNSAGILKTLVNDKQGLRFNYTLTTTTIGDAETVTINQKVYKVKKVGMLVTRDPNAIMKVGNAGVKNAYVTSARTIDVDGDKTTYGFSILVKNIPRENKHSDVYARPYLECEDGTILYGIKQVTNAYEMYMELCKTYDFDATIDSWMIGGLLGPEDSDDPLYNDDNWTDGTIPE